MLATGPSAISLVTADELLYDEAIEFYQQLGFIINAEWNTQEVQLSLSAHANGSLRETTLVLFGVGQNNDASIRLRYASTGVPGDVSRKQVKHMRSARDTMDWRAVESCQIIVVDEIDVELFKDMLTQRIPPTEDCKEMYVVDPLGNLVAFTVQKMISNTRKGASGATTPGYLTTVPSREDLREYARASTGGSEAQGPRKRIGVLTSGGDAPGMNAAVRSVVRSGINQNCDVYAINEGYSGLIKGGDMIHKMSWDDVRGYLSIGGTLIGTARCMEFRERAGRLQACYNMIERGIDALIVIGGDGSLTGADTFRDEWPGLIKELLDTKRIDEKQYKAHQHLNISGMVGSIDNDMAMTDHTIGAYSSLSRICTNISWVSATAESHSRAFVVEVMGRHCGWLALMASIACRADYVFLPEMPPTANEWVGKMQSVIERHRKGGRRSTLVVVAEGAIDSELNRISPEMVKDALVEIGLDTRVTTLGHVQRGGSPVAFDRLLATLQGAEAVRCVLESTPETPSEIIGIRLNKIIRVPLQESVAATKRVAEAISKKDFQLARSLRDSDFNEVLENYLSISSADITNKDHLKAAKPMRIGIIAVGAPAGGMNAAISTAACYCLVRGHTPLAILNSWSGLARHESIKELDWMSADRMATLGGCEIGCNRSLPDVDFGMIAYHLSKHDIDGLMIIGGFEAYKSLQMLENARNIFPAFRIPMVCLPATISNNVPGTDLSLGCDTCLNSLTTYCDIVKQSASSTRRRAFVVEVQGGNSGFIAANTALITGAHACYVPEKGIQLEQLTMDIRHLRECFRADQGRQRAGRLIILNEKASRGFTTQNIVSIYSNESEGAFDVREAVPGHIQQGGLPSPLDQIRGSRLAVRCIKFLEEMPCQWSRETRSDKSTSACVIGVVEAKVKLTPIKYLWEYETDETLRRSNRMSWYPVLLMANVMTGRPVIDEADQFPLDQIEQACVT
ncbi:ATP-dependent 6-phosphofructokinase [Wickerhamiella sorbophila]|uniref:ATP-dependent 6-phosphofructokinase n=1 Tax=Wickerhamiella sorbophila TaxID=45607 RepID=A0A2T0FGN6_9ASCO|nr:ATP-dependent 6-phosphofructokinase [Wickerhamiella sorbophila]PRT54163.1 ATP-dependent 6-phosphofructokinase [Wickerhamiella sorbophila]